MRVALTGGIGTGKLYCLQRFQALGVPVIDADVIARDVVAPGTEGLSAIARRFGPSVLLSDGSLNRHALAAVVFSDAYARQDLEDIVHPRVYEQIDRWFGALPASAIGVADVPLLYETGREGDFERVVVAACPPDVQMARLLARGMTPADAELRVAAQMSIEDKIAKADFVIDTSKTKAETDRQVVEVWERLRADVAAGL